MKRKLTPEMLQVIRREEHSLQALLSACDAAIDMVSAKDGSAARTSQQRMGINVGNAAMTISPSFGSRYSNFFTGQVWKRHMALKDGRQPVPEYRAPALWWEVTYPLRQIFKWLKWFFLWRGKTPDQIFEKMRKKHQKILRNL